MFDSAKLANTATLISLKISWIMRVSLRQNTVPKIQCFRQEVALDLTIIYHRFRDKHCVTAMERRYLTYIRIQMHMCTRVDKRVHIFTSV